MAVTPATLAAAERERRDIVTGEVMDEARLIRFVAGPGGVVAPDLARKLPGRGLWVAADRASVEAAAKKGLFARAAKAKVTAPPDLADLDRIYDYTLASNAKAADLLAEWALLPVPGGGGQGRQVDMYHHPEGQPLSRVRVSVQRGAYGARVSVGEDGARHVLGDYDRKSLADHLHNVI